MECVNCGRPTNEMVCMRCDKLISNAAMEQWGEVV